MILVSNVAICQNDSIPDTVRYVNPNPDLFREEFIICRSAKVFLFANETVNEMVSLRKNFTDQFLQLCTSTRILPASKIWGFNLDNKYYRSGHTFDNNYVFAERIVTGKMSLFYCRNIPNNYGEIELISSDPNASGYTNRMIVEDVDSKRYKSDFSYFLSLQTDSAKMIWVNNNNIGTVANEYFINSPAAYKDAMQYVKKNRWAERLTLTVGVASYLLSVFDFQRGGIILFHYQSPLLYVSLASIGTYIYIRVKNKHRYLNPDNMARIVSKYNGQVVK
jgi:hypothetical protein